MYVFLCSHLIAHYYILQYSIVMLIQSFTIKNTGSLFQGNLSHPDNKTPQKKNSKMSEMYHMVTHHKKKKKKKMLSINLREIYSQTL